MANATDEPASPAGTEPAGTIRGVLTDLSEVAEELPVSAARIEHVARLLDRLSEELTEAAAMLRGQPAP
jgi:hypothetical protein